MIEITVQEMINSIEVLREIANKKMPAKTAYRFARINKEIERENDVFQETRRDLILKYGEKDEKGKLKEENGNITIPKEQLADFRKESSELLNTCITINADRLDIEDFGDDMFSPTEIGKIEWVIKENGKE